jgi:glycosyltransferase involved in cell wall biosynthesis
LSNTSELNLTVVVPAYNEGENVTPVVREIVDTIAASPWVGPYEVVLINDGSTDNTGAVMDGLARELPQVRVFHHPVNRGFGAGLRTGFTNSRGKVVCFITADGEIGIDQALRLVKEIGDHDLLQSGRERTVGADRKFLTWGVDLMMHLILGFKYDGQVGIYIIRGDVVRSIPLYSETGLANLEVILYCQDRKLKIGKSGITHARPRLSGESKVTNLPTILRTLWEMWKLRLRVRRQRKAGGRT